MRHTKPDNLIKIIGIIVLINSIVNWHIFKLITMPNYGALVAVVLLFLSIASSIGMILVKRCGLWAFSALVFVITIFFSISLVPFITSFFSPDIRILVMITINISLLITVIISYYKLKSIKN